VQWRRTSGPAGLTTYAPIAPLGCWSSSSCPRDEAYQPLFFTMQRTGVVLLARSGLAVLAGWVLARKMWCDPGLAGRRRADRQRRPEQRISIKTGDELEALADQFNDMAGKLQTPTPTWKERSKPGRASLPSP